MARAFGCRRCLIKWMPTLDEKHSAVTERLLVQVRPRGCCFVGKTLVVFHLTNMTYRRFYKSLVTVIG
jgi:hypothetical protein